MRSSCAMCVAVVATLAMSPPADAQAPTDSLQLSAAWPTDRYLPRDATLAFSLNRAARSEEGRLAIVVGHTDLSSVVEVRGTRVRLPLRGQRLPAGEGEVQAFLVAPDGSWRPLGSFPLKRLGRGGFEAASVRPRVDMQSDGQLDARLPDGASKPPRGTTYQDVNLNGGFEGSFRRAGGEATTSMLLMGTTKEEGRLRAAQLGPQAPMIDLASYRLRLAKRGRSIEAGHVSMGSQRLLLNSFSSRGITAAWQLAKGVALQVGSTAGSEIVGWRDPLGLSRPTHRVSSASLGIEAIPSRPGLVRVEVATLDGSRQPIAGFNQQFVTEREQSRGVGVQVAAADPSQRLRLSLGTARSRFANPTDPTISRDSAIVAVRPETRTARFGELSLDAVRAARIGKSTASLSLTARHERVDPQYRSIGAFAQADREEDGVGANAALDALQLQYSAQRSRDNLAAISTLLVTRNRGQSLTAALPVAQLLRAKPDAWWWPSLTFAWQGTWQIGDAVPDSGGFRFDFQRPDQRTDNLAYGASWQRSVWNLSARWNRSLVDNRQAERERADLQTDVGAVTIGIVASQRLSLGMDFSRERMLQKENATRARNDRASLQGDWRPTGSTAVNGAFSLVRTNDAATTQRGSNTEFRVEASQGMNLYRRPTDGTQMRAFVRFARTGQAIRVGETIQPYVMQWTLNGGLSFRLF